MMLYTDVMVDIETLGTTPGCSIISIGAIGFNILLEQDEWMRFYSGPISRESNRRCGLKEDRDTVEWWQTQSQEARVVFEEASRPCRGIDDALAAFKKFFPENGKIWGNGADFDNPVLSVAYKAVGIKQPWNHWNSRCYRTMKNIFKKVEAPEFIGTRHNALDDAFHQTRHLVKILEEAYR
jgi:hypothetical protein